MNMTTNHFLCQIFRQNVINELSDPFGKPQDILDKLNEDGSFCDLDYTNQNWTTWHPYQHMCRVAKLCTICYCPQNAHYRNKQAEQAIITATKYWIDGHFVAENWWMNDVGIPMCFGVLMLFYPNALGEAYVKRAKEYVKGNPNRSRIFLYNDPKTKGMLRPYNSTACHMASTMVDTLKYLASADMEEAKIIEWISDCYKALSYELCLKNYAAGHSPSGVYADEHSIKSDYSYHEHNSTLLQNTYGTAFLNSTYEIFRFTKGMDLHLTKQAANEFANLLLDGYAFMRFKNFASMMTLGRNVGSADTKSLYSQDTANSIIGISERLIQDYPDIKRKQELLSLTARTKHPESTPNMHRCRYFWHSDILSHNREDYQFTVHAVSNRLKRPESILKKNLLGMFLGDGCYNLLKRGNEYEQIAPFMDWYKLPGVTADQGEKDLNPETEIDTKIDPDNLFGGAHGTTSFVGGVSDDEYGFFVYDYDHMGVKAKKGWFTFDDEIVCLGAGICSDSQNGAFTTVNQCRLFTDVTADGRVKDKGEHDLSGVKCVTHDGVSYIFTGNEHLLLENGRKTGSWSRVDKDSGTDEPVSGEVFLLGINHGKAPENAGYEYVIQLKEHTKHAVVLENTDKIQAVWNGSLQILQAAFYQQGTVKTPSGLVLSVDKPCAILYRKQEEGYRLWASNPEHTALELKVSLSGTVKDEMIFDLEEGTLFNNLGRPLGYDSNTGFVGRE